MKNSVDRMLNILFVQHSPCIRNYKLAVALRAAGHRVVLAYRTAKLSERYVGMSDDCYDENIRWRSHRELWDMVDGYDVVHCHNEPDTPTLSAMVGSAPVIHDTHDLISLRDVGTANVGFFEGLANRGADGRVYSTEYQLEEAKRLYGVSGPSLVFHNLVSRAQLPKSRLEKLSGGDGQVHFVYQGGLGGGAHRDFKRSFSEISASGAHVHIYPVTYDDEFARHFDGNERVHYQHPVSPSVLMEELTKFDFGLIPWKTTDENRRFLDSTIANKLFEYLAAGIPVAAGDLVSYRNYFKRNPVGITFRSSEELIAGIPRLMDIAANTDFSKQVFCVEDEIHRVEEFYRQVISEKHRGR